MASRRQKVIVGSAIAAMALLATWLVRTYLDALDASSTSRTRADLRTLATALRAYRADHGVYPPMIPMHRIGRNSTTLEKAGGGAAMGISYALTTPVAYVDSFSPFVDIFSPAVPPAYFTRGDEFILYSPALDRDYDITPQRLAAFPTFDKDHFDAAGLTYDPTNGLRSSGDFWRTNRE